MFNSIQVLGEFFFLPSQIDVILTSFYTTWTRLLTFNQVNLLFKVRYPFKSTLKVFKSTRPRNFL